MNKFFFSCCLAALLRAGAYAQQPGAYQQPPQAITDILAAPRLPELLPSPDRHRLLQLAYDYGHLPVQQLARPELQLAGVRMNPQTNFPARQHLATGLRIRQTTGDTTARPVQDLPARPAIVYPAWSPDGTKIAFCQVNDDNVELWVCDAGTRRARRLFKRPLNFPLDFNPVVWAPDSRSVLCLTLPPRRGAPPVTAEATGPVIQENDGKPRPVRAYPNMLKNPHDEALFDHYFRAALVRVGLDGKARQVGPEGIFLSYDYSPDGRYVLAKYIRKPYSYTVNVYRFPHEVVVLGLRGDAGRRIADLPVNERTTGRDAVAPAPRGHAWRPDKPATLYWVEALDGGDPRRAAAARDRIMTLDAPFTAPAATLCHTSMRFDEVYWGNDSVALVAERWWDTRQMRWLLCNPARGAITDTLARFPLDNAYEMPGEPFLATNAAGKKVLSLAPGQHVLLAGLTHSAEHGLRPVLKQFSLRSKTSRVLWQSQPPFLETFVGMIGDRDLLLSRQSPTTPPNFAVHHLPAGTTTPVTAFADRLAALRQIGKKELTYRRADGVPLNATLYYPAGHDAAKGPLPTLVWAYPMEYKDKSSAGQNYTSPYAYLGNYTHQMLLALAGYAVLDYASFPVVGEGAAHPNDTYLEQLRENARAALAEGARHGLVDTARVAIGGHSYGAFMAANLLTHTTLFKTGIAQSGAYNRTLTPFGFQKEDRTYWQAPELYDRLSPFRHADKLKYPLLLVHGDADNNPGTFTLQSDRYYEAIKGLGGVVRYVRLPYESHTYLGRESLLHVCWEMISWLDRHLKQPGGGLRTSVNANR